MVIDIAPYIGLLIALAGCVALSARIGVLRHAGAQAEAARKAACGVEQNATRLLRMAAHELRGIGMTLHGHADRMAASRAATAACVDATMHAVGLAAAASQVLGLADELQDQTLPDPATHSLREELIAPGDALAAAVEACVLALEPGRRQWRIAPVPPDLRLWADRRALRHALGRVMADAARNTRQDDCIDLSVQPHRDGICIVVEDEGSGLASPELGTQPMRDSRGIGLRLALARALMLAHGGRLEVQAAARVGTRVGLVFPTDRLRDATGQRIGAGQIVWAQGALVSG